MDGENSRRAENEELFRGVAVHRRRLLLLLPLGVVFVLVVVVFVQVVVALTQPSSSQLGAPIAGPFVGAGQKLGGGELRQRGVDGAFAGPAVILRSH